MSIFSDNHLYSFNIKTHDVCYMTSATCITLTGSIINDILADIFIFVV